MQYAILICHARGTDESLAPDELESVMAECFVIEVHDWTAPCSSRPGSHRPVSAARSR
ncbi:MAG TPA: hypothetical protein VFN55_04725 [Solirubrobacteraceae bacterium]|nr:hypothetical protein [Solirubrobacteraceae bacterium]